MNDDQRRCAAIRNRPASYSGRRGLRKLPRTQEQICRDVRLLSAIHQRHGEGQRNPTEVTVYKLATSLGISNLELLRPLRDE